MPLFFIPAGIIILSVAVLFISRRFSPVPYFPSNKKDIENIVRALKVRNGQTIYDLGAGDGIVIFSAAQHAIGKNVNTEFIAVEINPILIGILWFKWLFHPNRKNIQIVRDDIFSIQYTKYPIRDTNFTFFTYVSPWYLERIYSNVKSQIKVFDWISYYYPIPKLNRTHIIKGVHPTYVYRA